MVNNINILPQRIGGLFRLRGNLCIRRHLLNQGLLGKYNNCKKYRLES